MAAVESIKIFQAEHDGKSLETRSVRVKEKHKIRRKLRNVYWITITDTHRTAHPRCREEDCVTKGERNCV